MSTPHRSPRRPGLLGSALAALVTTVAVCAGDAVARVFPYGPRHRSINDLGNQFVPFHAHLWDLLHGRAGGGLLLNWQSGYGTSFLPDFGTYLTSPFAVLVGLFPRQDIDLAVYVVTVVKTAAAAAAMAWLLRTQRRGPAWAAGLLGASYALCGWSVIEASYNPMWLDGLIAFPLLCLTGEWALRSRRPVVAVVVVALCWTANFYTAYMATLGAVLVLLVRLLLTRKGAARQLRVLVRAALTTTLGVALSAPVLVPSSSARSRPTRGGPGRSSRWRPRTCCPGCCPPPTPSPPPPCSSAPGPCCSWRPCPSTGLWRGGIGWCGRGSSCWCCCPSSGCRRTWPGTSSRRPTAARTGRPSCWPGSW